MALGTANISTGLVAQTIQENSSDVGTLCKSTKINKWSKFKPVSYQSLNGVNDTILKSIDYGFTYPRSNQYITIASQKWTYNKPSGGSASPFRLGDFRGYSHIAEKLLGTPSISEINIFENPSLVITFPLAGLSDGQLQMSDFSGIIANQYVGIVITSGLFTINIITSNLKLSEGGNSITIDLTAAPFSGVRMSSDFTFYYILSNVMVNPISSNETAYISNNLFIPIPNNDGDNSIDNVTVVNRYAGVFSISHIADSINATFYEVDDFLGIDDPQLYFVTISGNTYYKATINNPTSSAISFNRLYMKLKHQENFHGYERNETLSVYDSNKNLMTDIISIPANSSLDIYIGIDSTLFRNGTETNAGIITPLNGSQLSTNTFFYYKGAQVFVFNTFRFTKL